MATNARTTPILDVRNLYVDYYAENGTVHAVTDVSLTLQRGEILGLAGESGSGKSTLAYAITRLLRPPAVITGGEVLYSRSYEYGKDISLTRLSRSERGEHKKIEDTTQPIDILQLSPAEL